MPPDCAPKDFQNHYSLNSIFHCIQLLKQLSRSVWLVCNAASMSSLIPTKYSKINHLAVGGCQFPLRVAMGTPHAGNVLKIRMSDHKL